MVQIHMKFLYAEKCLALLGKGSVLTETVLLINAVYYYENIVFENWQITN